MRARVMRTSRKLLLIVVAIASTAMWASAADPPERSIFMRSNWEFLPPFLDTEKNLSLYMAHEGHGGPGQTSYSRFGATQHALFSDSVLSLNAEGFITNDGHGGVTALLHTRRLVGSGLVGVGASFTVQESPSDRVFNQGGVHVEIFPNDDWSFRGNGYLPTGPRQRETFNSGPVEQPAIFSGNNLIVPTLTTTMEESAMKGLEGEIARKIGDLAAEAFVGYYKFNAQSGRDAEGGKVGIRGYLTDRVQGHFAVSNDNRFDINVFGGIVWNYGGAAGLAPDGIQGKLTIPVERNHQVVLSQGNIRDTWICCCHGRRIADHCHARPGRCPWRQCRDV